MAALGKHYQRALQDLTTYLGAQIPRAHQAELPPLLFAPPPILVPTPFSIPVSILPIALAYVAILHVLMRSLALCAGTVGGFELDSTCQPSTRPFSTARVPAYPTHPTRSYPWPTQTYQLQRGYSCPPPPPQQGTRTRLHHRSRGTSGLQAPLRRTTGRQIGLHGSKVGGSGAPGDDRST
jgi:hypothetical protein